MAENQSMIEGRLAQRHWIGRLENNEKKNKEETLQNKDLPKLINLIERFNYKINKTKETVQTKTNQSRYTEYEDH